MCLRCSGNINGNMNSFFQLTTLPKYWHLGPIMASQLWKNITKSLCLKKILYEGMNQPGPFKDIPVQSTLQ